MFEVISGAFFSILCIGLFIYGYILTNPNRTQAERTKGYTLHSLGFFFLGLMYLATFWN